MNNLYREMQSQAIQSNLTNNPQLQQVMQMVRASNMTPKEYFYALAKQKGVDPNSILGMFR